MSSFNIINVLKTIKNRFFGKKMLKHLKKTKNQSIIEKYAPVA